MTNRVARHIRKQFGFARIPSAMQPYEKAYYRSLKARYAKLPHDQRAAFVADEAVKHHAMIGSLRAAAIPTQS